jgi:DNA replication protein DnaC
MVAALRARMDREDEIRLRYEKQETAMGGVEVHTRPWRPAFRVVPVLLDTLRASVRGSDPDADDDLRYVRDASDLLVLDDFGREKPTDWVIERLYAVVEKRYGELRGTCVTSNLSLDQLADHGYQALVSRLTETCDIVKITASDFRPEKGRASPLDGAVTVRVRPVGSR